MHGDILGPFDPTKIITKRQQKGPEVKILPKNVCFVYEAPSANFRGVRWSKHSPLDASCHVQSPFQLCLTYFGLLKLLMAQYGS